MGPGGAIIPHFFFHLSLFSRPLAVFRTLVNFSIFILIFSTLQTNGRTLREISPKIIRKYPLSFMMGFSACRSGIFAKIDEILDLFIIIILLVFWAIFDCDENLSETDSIFSKEPDMYHIYIFPPLFFLQVPYYSSNVSHIIHIIIVSNYF